jgi:hypothetical protein
MLRSFWKCTLVTPHDDPRNVGGEPPTNRSTDLAALLHELIEALTALGNYLETARQVSAGQSDTTLATALERSVDQFERSVAARAAAAEPRSSD